MKGRPHTYRANWISECSGPKQQRPQTMFVPSITSLACVAALDNTGACADGGGR
jgi:hypothetical protein